ncbi:hypothetical protein Acr_09g0003120 [Actinidia rufa]|uniref:Reverse transcriptase domain-containing protein n=1 Tax=Actinidia rufa TaxID=165716 RepID=A0A7J0F616_9ERIC|nr:hypothetical protein Acr_09g0003120 [Actinidia rufa]
MSKLPLIRPVSDEDIKAALFDIGDDKAPGPYGFSSCFFKKSWSITGPDVCAAVKEFFVSGKILKQLNHAVLVMVPKSASASRVEDFRPIACCNVIYKVISKIIATRLSPILEDLIDPAQLAFVPNRSMDENIYELQELLRNYSWSRISPRCIMKIDLRKACDMVNWDFLRDVLSGLGFPGLFVEWIMQCISTTTFSISINGALHGFFKGQQGLRQGDPLSPFLFVICLEYLSRKLGNLRSNPDFNFHPKCSAVNLTHLAFADDLILFARGSHRNPQVAERKSAQAESCDGLIFDCLKNFGECSGLCISPNKSNLFMAGISREEAEEIKTITGFSLGRFPFCYLGIPVAAPRLSIEQFSSLISKIAEYINAWAGATLSCAGRCELIRSVLQGVECFWLSILPIPVGVRNKTTSLCRNFLWGGNAMVLKKPLVAWKDIRCPKSEGGLGFIDLHAWNLALLSKSLWNLQSKKDSVDFQTIRKLVLIRNEIFTLEGSTQTALERVHQWAATGRFNTRACYEFFRPKGPKITWAKLAWHHSLMPKHSFILWLGLKDKLLTREKLINQIDGCSCPLCGAPIESLNHLFFHRSEVRQVWTDIKKWLGFTRALTAIRAAAKWITKKRLEVQAYRLLQRRLGLPALFIVFGKQEMQGSLRAKSCIQLVLSEISRFKYTPFMHLFLTSESYEWGCILEY